MIVIARTREEVTSTAVLVTSAIVGQNGGMAKRSPGFFTIATPPFNAEVMASAFGLRESANLPYAVANKSRLCSVDG